MFNINSFSYLFNNKRIVSFLNKLLILSYKCFAYFKLFKCEIILSKFIKNNFFNFPFAVSSKIDEDSGLLLVVLLLVLLLLLQVFGNIFKKILKKILSIPLPSSQFVKRKKLEV